MTIDAKTVRWTLLAAVVLSAVVVTGALLAHRGEREWTTDSEAALAEFERGLGELQRLYTGEAAERFERALEIDPDLVAAKLFLVESGVAEARREELLAELRATDRTRINARERFLIDYHLAARARDPERAEEVLAEYLERHPDDPFALQAHCWRLWQGRDFAEAERLYRRLIEIDPNWVTAQNHLGYAAMAQGDWERAAEQFDVYRYLAPDQANPHDSLGELLLLTGRWEEARREFEAALAIKPDFYHSWGNLVTLELLAGRFDEARRILDGIARDGLAGEEFIRHQRCRVGVWRAFDGADWRGVLDAYRGPECDRPYESTGVMAYEAALLAGLPEEAEALRKEFESELETRASSFDRRVTSQHMEGIRLRIEGRPEEAVETLRRVDELLAYWNSGLGYFKLANRSELWSALRAAGRHDEAERLLAEMREVNAAIADRWTSHAAVRPATVAAEATPPAS